MKGLCLQIIGTNEREDSQVSGLHPIFNKIIEKITSVS